MPQATCAACIAYVGMMPSNSLVYSLYASIQANGWQLLKLADLFVQYGQDAAVERMMYEKAQQEMYSSDAEWLILKATKPSGPMAISGSTTMRGLPKLRLKLLTRGRDVPSCFDRTVSATS